MNAWGHTAEICPTLHRREWPRLQKWQKRICGSVLELSKGSISTCRKSAGKIVHLCKKVAAGQTSAVDSINTTTITLFPRHTRMYTDAIMPRTRMMKMMASFTVRALCYLNVITVSFYIDFLSHDELNPPPMYSVMYGRIFSFHVDTFELSGRESEKGTHGATQRGRGFGWGRGFWFWAAEWKDFTNTFLKGKTQNYSFLRSLQLGLKKKNTKQKL